MDEQKLVDEALSTAAEIEKRVLEAIGDKEKVTHVILALTHIISTALAIDKSKESRAYGAKFLLQSAAYAAKDAGIKQYGLFNIIEQAYQDNGEVNV